MESGGPAVQLFRWLRPQAYKRASKYLEELVDLTSTFEPLLPERLLASSSTVPSRDKFDVSVHHQLNYTEALSRFLLGQGSFSA